jgi:SagB-type dehydrogenase family enzyme
MSLLALVLLVVGTDSLVRLPAPDTLGLVTVEHALQHRRSVRSFTSESLSQAQLGQVLWAAQGVTSSWGGRAAPSAGATYPMELYVVAGRVEGLAPGVYHYFPSEHSLRVHRPADVRTDLAGAALGQSCVSAAAFTLVLAADYGRTTARYGERGRRYVHMEAGHVGQNVHLQCEALELGTVMVGAFRDDDVRKVVGIAEEPLYLMPVGRPR